MICCLIDPVVVVVVVVAACGSLLAAVCLRQFFSSRPRDCQWTTHSLISGWHRVDNRCAQGVGLVRTVVDFVGGGKCLFGVATNMSNGLRPVNLSSHCLTRRLLQLKLRILVPGEVDHYARRNLQEVCTQAAPTGDADRGLMDKFVASCRLLLKCCDEVQRCVENGTVTVPTELVATRAPPRDGHDDGDGDLARRTPPVVDPRPPPSPPTAHMVLLDWLLVEPHSVSRSTEPRHNQVLPNTRRALFASGCAGHLLSTFVVVVVGVGLDHPRPTLEQLAEDEASAVVALLTHLRYASGTRVYYAAFTQSSPTLLLPHSSVRRKREAGAGANAGAGSGGAHAGGAGAGPRFVPFVAVGDSDSGGGRQRSSANPIRAHQVRLIDDIVWTDEDARAMTSTAPQQRWVVVEPRAHSREDGIPNNDANSTNTVGSSSNRHVGRSGSVNTTSPITATTATTSSTSSSSTTTTSATPSSAQHATARTCTRARKAAQCKQRGAVAFLSLIHI